MTDKFNVNMDKDGMYYATADTKELENKYNEIIKKEFNWKVWQYKGLWCVINRHPNLQHLNAYIGLPDKVDIGSHTYEHPWFQYDEGYYDPDYGDLHSFVNVHGGITWGPQYTDNGVMSFHIKKKLTWIGFDCGHLGDWTPGSPSGEYRTMDYVTQECNRVVDDYYETLVDKLKAKITTL